MACGKPLIQYADKKLYEKFYSEPPPILNARNEEQVYDRLSSLYENHDLASNIGNQSRKWLLKHHNIQNLIKKYVYVHRAISEGTDTKDIINNLSKNN